VVPPCPVPNGVSATSRLDDAPPSLARALTERVGEMVPAGAEFDATDVVVSENNRRPKHRRLIFIWNQGNRWVVATERGGAGYSNPIVAFDIIPDDLTATFVQERVAFPDSVCPTASSLLAVGNLNLPAAPPGSWPRCRSPSPPRGESPAQARNYPQTLARTHSTWVATISATAIGNMPEVSNVSSLGLPVISTGRRAFR
jgi:hypothetical protein